jgi:predicted chitinase
MNDRVSSMKLQAAGTGCPSGGGSGIGSVVSEAQWNAWFPNHIAFYTYQGLLDAAAAYPTFCNSSDMTIRKREAAALFADFAHESDFFRAVREYNTANYCSYCDWSQPYGCPAGQCEYYGRGPVQLSWNYNYKSAGDSLGINLLNSPDQVATNNVIAWKTAIRYWMVEKATTCHAAMENTGLGFHYTIRAINGGLECPSMGGTNTAARDARIQRYTQFCSDLGVSVGTMSGC